MSLIYRPGEIHNEGADAYHDGILYEQCPYDETDERRELWQTGWLEQEENTIEAWCGDEKSGC